ncbi:hypothetical protein FISHEDRAFT_49059 [Fistulina hepatica ATCC 64428]|uniref:Zn(2)-C6 fungal-type domain-containing protein n=1 Tax=Fistulina hepatica ATCC 64428 TaxID=1128425 RepID=A0A0D7A4F6_9AGAR|nr:hypothetical protein FISHEDRAFT_49059 [Fistulina hepatica ATCC 64428]
MQTHSNPEPYGVPQYPFVPSVNVYQDPQVIRAIDHVQDTDQSFQADFPTSIPQHHATYHPLPFSIASYPEAPSNTVPHPASTHVHVSSNLPLVAELVNNEAPPLDTSFASLPLSAPTVGPPSAGSSISAVTNIKFSSFTREKLREARKSRREKPRLMLAPDQPLTTQGRPRARVFVACRQCRSKKTRCDGAKPVCYNCQHRTDDHTCTYDSVPKRRGPDKRPGARQRRIREAKLRSGMSFQWDDPSSHLRASHLLDCRPESSSHDQVSPQSQIDDEVGPCLGGIQTLDMATSSTKNVPLLDTHLEQHHLYNNKDVVYAEYGEPSYPNNVKSQSRHNIDIAQRSAVDHAYVANFDEIGCEPDATSFFPLFPEPSLAFSQKMWWEALLSLSASMLYDTHGSSTVAARAAAAENIVQELKYLLRTSPYWFSFIHIPSFFAKLCDVRQREGVQPSLILAALAIASLLQGSELRQGRPARENALRYREAAQSSLESSLNANWIDEGLAQAAWLCVLFELCVHPQHSLSRLRSAVCQLDAIIRYTRLTEVDAEDPLCPSFQSRAVPALGSPVHILPTACPSQHGCDCLSITLEAHWPHTAQYAPMWAKTPAWSPHWDEPEIRRESIRRLVWGSVFLETACVHYAWAFGTPPIDLFIFSFANFRVRFSAESTVVSMGNPDNAKETIWALYDRIFLVHNSCIRMKTDKSMSQADKSHFSLQANTELDCLERALARHTCDIERTFLWMGREYLFKCVRNCPILYGLVSFSLPCATHCLFPPVKDKAMMAKRIMTGFSNVTGNQYSSLDSSPYFVPWLMTHMQMYRALYLYSIDNTFTETLELCKAVKPIVDYLLSLWPCTGMLVSESVNLAAFTWQPTELRKLYDDLLATLSPLIRDI